MAEKNTAEEREEEKTEGEGREGQNFVTQLHDLILSHLAPDVVLEILRYLPAQSVGRFKLISKWFNDMIGIRGTLFSSRTERLYLTTAGEDGGYGMLSCSLTAPGRFDLDSKNQRVEGYRMVVLRGLILLTHHDRQASIFNPTTTKMVTLPPIKSDILSSDSDSDDIMSSGVVISNSYYFFGYDRVLDQYKVVAYTLSYSKHAPRIYHQQFLVLVLNAGRSWEMRNIDFSHPHIPITKGLCINGAIYYLANCFDSGYFVMCFNVQTEELSIIELPNEVYDGKFWDLDFIIHGGKPCLFYYDHKNTQSHLWIWDLGTWSNRSLPLLHGQIPFSLKVIGTTRQGEVIMKSRVSLTDNIYYYNVLQNAMRRVTVRGIWCCSTYSTPTDLVHVDEDNIVTFQEV